MSALYSSETEVNEFATKVDNSFQNVANHLVSITRKKYGISHDEPLDMLLDVGCASGGSTRLFESHFKSIVGFDPSESQINLAKKIPCGDNINYLVGSGEKMPVEDECSDMIVSFWAIHFMDIDKFVSECKRVLKPKGCCFAYAYDYRNFTMVGKKSVSVSVQDHFYRYWDRIEVYYKENYPQINKQYARYQSIFERLRGLKKSRIDTLTYQSNVMSLQDFKSRLSSIPELIKCSLAEKAKGRSDPIEDLISNIKTTWGVVDKAENEIEVKFTFSFYVLCLEK